MADHWGKTLLDASLLCHTHAPMLACVRPMRNGRYGKGWLATSIMAGHTWGWPPPVSYCHSVGLSVLACGRMTFHRAGSASARGYGRAQLRFENRASAYHASCREGRATGSVHTRCLGPRRRRISCFVWTTAVAKSRTAREDPALCQCAARRRFAPGEKTKCASDQPKNRLGQKPRAATIF